MERLPVLTGYQVSTRKLEKMTHTFMANLGGRETGREREWNVAGGLARLIVQNQSYVYWLCGLYRRGDGLELVR